MTKLTDDNQIKELLKDTFEKIESTSNQDTKILTEMNNSLNWILALTTLMFGVYTTHHFSEQSCFEIVLSILSRILFILLVTILVLHKLILIKYERTKSTFLESLRTHYLELKYDLPKLRNKFSFNDGSDLIGFINDFRNANFILFPTIDGRVSAFANYDKALNRDGLILKVSFVIGIIIFCLYFLGIIILLTK